MGANRFLIKKTDTVTKFYYLIRLRLKLKKEEALFLFVNGKEALKSDTIFSKIYDQKKNSDGFLYIAYTTENVLGKLNK